jgi:hypothetical protein
MKDHESNSGSRSQKLSAGESNQTNAVDKNYDSTTQNGIQTPEEVAIYYKKSTSWVYDHWEELGGVKLGGSLFFPSKEDLYERLFNKRQRIPLRLYAKRTKTHGNVVQNKKGGKKSRRTAKGRVEQAGGEDSNRHGILDPG